jgi:hypothetical protein
MDSRIHQLHLQAGKKAGEERTCGSKNAFETEENAQKASDAHNKWKERRHDVEPYPCAFCHKWHIGKIMPVEVLELFAEDGLYEALGEVVDAACLNEWFETPNEAFDGLKPINAGTDRLWEMLHRLRSGEPG